MLPLDLTEISFSNNPMKAITLLASLAAGLSLAGCATEKNRPLSERGWIGSQYALARHQTFLRMLAADTGVVNRSAKSLPPDRKAAVLLTHLGTNSPAALAGLREGDFVVELNHQPVGSLQQFHRVIDRTLPVAQLPIRVFRDGQFLDYTAAVGREKYRPGGCLTLAFPTVVHGWDLWPNPGFSFVVLGYEPNPGLREELNGDPKKHDVYDEEHVVFLACVQVSKGKLVVSQEPASN